MRRRRKRAANAALPVRHAVALGILHGPTELLPVSSSAHITLVPWLARWPYAGMDAELRKAFEVALHAGTAAALLIGLRDEVGDAVRGFDRRRAILVAGSFIPPAIVGYTLERPIERRLGTPGTISIGLLAGSAAMALADRLGPTGRSRHDARPADALWLGLAQACALMPGASRNGMTLRGPADHRRRDGAQGHPPGAPRPAGGHVGGLRGGRRRLVRLDPGLDLAHPPGRARPLAGAVCGLPHGARARGAHPAARREHARPPIPRRCGAMSDAYAAAGVDTSQADRGVDALVGVLRTIELDRPSASVLASGHYASVLRVTPQLGIALSTDGVGSKIVVAEQAGRLETVGIDCIAMNVNDVVCVGAEPIAMLDYLAVEQVDPEALARIAAGLKVGAQSANIEIPGGELAVLPELIRGHPSPHGFDLCGTAIGTVALDAIVTGADARPGDALIGLPSSGLHSRPSSAGSPSPTRCSSRP